MHLRTHAGTRPRGQGEGLPPGGQFGQVRRGGWDHREEFGPLRLPPTHTGAVSTQDR